jgi:hypothetical protein
MDIPATTTVAEQQPVQSNKALLDRAALAADASLHASSRYEQVGVDAGNGWQRQENGGVRGSDWFGGAQAAVIYIVVNDPHEATYFIRDTDAKGALLDGRYAYTMTFPKDALPPVDRTRGGFATSSSASCSGFGRSISFDMEQRCYEGDLKPDLLSSQRGRGGQCRDLVSSLRDLLHGLHQRRTRNRCPALPQKSAAFSIRPASVQWRASNSLAPFGPGLLVDRELKVRKTRQPLFPP